MSVKDITNLQVCIAYRLYHQLYRFTGKYPYHILIEMTGQPEKVCFRAMERAVKHGYVDYGVSLRTGFLTNKGKMLCEGR